MNALVSIRQYFFQSKSLPGKKPSKSSGKNPVKSPEPHQEAMEAWKRRKNYNPMIAAGMKCYEPSQV